MRDSAQPFLFFFVPFLSGLGFGAPYFEDIGQPGVIVVLWMILEGIRDVFQLRFDFLGIGLIIFFFSARGGRNESR